MGMALTEKVARGESDIIALVRIVATTRAVPAPSATDLSEPKGDSFRRTATARVISAVKGCKEGDTLQLAFDNGLSCPNVVYAEKEDCLVFLKKERDDRYVTLNLYCGRFSVEDGKVSDFYLMHPSDHAPKSLPVADVLAWLREPPARSGP